MAPELIISERTISIDQLVGICPRCGGSTAYVLELIYNTGKIEYRCTACRFWIGSQN